MDMILTGRPVSGKEAVNIGLVNRISAPGESRKVAEELALQIAGFPQICMRNDRLSALEQHNLPLDAALSNEWEHGAKSLLAGETLEGAKRFAQGAGRHGSFDSAAVDHPTPRAKL
jgi:enoyl-CoA hydratase/carnithine racemase